MLSTPDTTSAISGNNAVTLKSRADHTDGHRSSQDCAATGYIFELAYFIPENQTGCAQLPCCESGLAPYA
jgi:hypothetical protein